MSDLAASWLKKFPHKRRPYLMAHRGNRVKYPENTMAAFRQAVEDGADILETDLHLSSDDQFVCIHDAAVDRTMNATGEVKDKTLKELRSLRALDKEKRETTETIPTLAELTEFLPEDVVLALELKTDRFHEKGINLRLRDLLNEKNVLDRTIVLSFSLKRLQAVKQVIPKMPVGWISASRLIPDKPVDLIGSLWPAFYLNPFYVRMAHKRGMLTCPLDPTPDARLGYYLGLGVDAVLSDDPEKTRRLLDQMQGRDIPRN
jgi:glycerophosphoryl diester phosphodiesterase